MPQITPLEERVLKLPVRKSPYWETLEYCRHIGIQKTGQTTGYWVARIRNKSGGYKQSRLMPWHSNNNELPQAVEMARIWFGTPSVSALAADPYPKGSKQALNYCPWGSDFTLGHALEDYVQWKRIAATKSHFDSLISQINYHILPKLGHVLLDELNGRDIIQFSIEVLETPPKRGNQKQGPRRKLAELSPDELRKRKKTLNTLIGILRLAVKLAWENGSTDSERAWRCIRRVPISDQPRTIFLSRQECAALLKSCRADLRDLVQGALYTGCRVAELSNLKVRDVACDVFGIYVAPLKSRRPRYVFLPDEGLAFFLTLCAGRMPEEYVFRHRSGYSWQGRHKHLFKDAVRNAGLPEEFVFHGLRHTYASQLVQAGTPLIVVAQQLGHANTDTVSRTYGHLAPQIREVQVRTHFAELDGSYADKAKRLSEKFQELSRSLQGSNWRDYGKVEPASSWPRSNFVTSASEVAQLLQSIERPN